MKTVYTEYIDKTYIPKHSFSLLALPYIKPS